jgi:hypothetical protein
MVKRVRPHLSFANIASALAVFIALGGTAWGVAANQIGSKQIKNRSVRKADLHKNAVTKSKVANNAVGSKEVRADSITGGDINETTLDSSIQRSLLNVCPAGQAISSITPQGQASCALIPESVNLTNLQNQVTTLAGQVAALCGSIRTGIETNFDALDAASLGGVVLPNLADNLPACP